MHLSVELYQIVRSFGSHVAAPNHKSSPKKGDAIPALAEWSGRSSRNRDGFMDRQYQRLLDFIEMGPGGNRERFLVVVRGFYILVRCVQSGTASWYASAAAPWIPDRAWKNGKEQISMEDLLKRVWHGNNRKQ